MVNIKYKNGKWTVTTEGGEQLPINRISLNVQAENDDYIDCTLYVDEFDVDVVEDQIKVVADGK